MCDDNIFDIEDDFEMPKDKLDDENREDEVAETEEKVAMAEEKRDAFRLKESQNMSNTIDMKSYSSGRGMERMSFSRSHKTVETSAVGSIPINIPSSFRSHSKEEVSTLKNKFSRTSTINFFFFSSRTKSLMSSRM